MSITKWKNQSGHVYAYETVAKYDPVLKQSRPVKKYLGRVDPESGEIIKTAGKRGRPPKAMPISTAEEQGNLQQALKEAKQALATAEARVERLEGEVSRLRFELAETIRREQKIAAFVRQLVDRGMKLVQGDPSVE